jgi:hypothetical protein
MKDVKHLEALKEVEDEIKAALDDPNGLIKHQRRLALMISLGMAELLELHLHNLGVVKEGSRIKHEWLKRGSAKEMLSNQVVKPLDDIKDIDRLLSLSKTIEDRRNDLAYSSPLDGDEILRDEIRLYFEAKKIVQGNTGDLHG